MNIFEKYLSKINKLILDKKNILKLTNFDNLNNVNLEVPPEQFNFDLSTNISLILSKANKLGIRTFIDPKGKDFSFYKNAFLLKPNQKEFEDIVGICSTKKSLAEKGEKLRKKLSLKYLLLTQGKKGMILFEENKVTSHIAHQQDVFDVTGAGDTVISILASYVISGKSMATAVKMSNIAAGLSIKKLGSTSVSQKELNNASKK